MRSTQPIATAPDPTAIGSAQVRQRESLRIRDSVLHVADRFLFSEDFISSIGYLYL